MWRYPGATDTVHCSQTLDWVVGEAAKDFPSADMLLKIVSAEKERLGNLVLEEGAVNKKSSKISWSSLLSPVANMSSFHIGLSPPEPGVGTVRSGSSTVNASEGAVLSSQVDHKRRSLFRHCLSLCLSFVLTSFWRIC